MSKLVPQEITVWQQAIRDNQAWSLEIKVVTNCPRVGWQGQMANGFWKVGLAEDAVDGRANQALLRWLAKELNCSVDQLKISRGQTSRRKIIAFKP